MCLSSKIFMKNKYKYQLFSVYLFINDLKERIINIIVKIFLQQIIKIIYWLKMLLLKN